MERHAIDEESAFAMLREQLRLAAAVVDGHRLLPRTPQTPAQP
jgi:hypothetical protein